MQTVLQSLILYLPRFFVHNYHPGDKTNPLSHRSRPSEAINSLFSARMTQRDFSQSALPSEGGATAANHSDAYRRALSHVEAEGRNERLASGVTMRIKGIETAGHDGVRGVSTPSIGYDWPRCRGWGCQCVSMCKEFRFTFP